MRLFFENDAQGFNNFQNIPNKAIGVKDAIDRNMKHIRASNKYLKYQIKKGNFGVDLFFEFQYENDLKVLYTNCNRIY